MKHIKLFEKKERSVIEIKLDRAIREFCKPLNFYDFRYKFYTNTHFIYFDINSTIVKNNYNDFMKILDFIQKYDFRCSPGDNNVFSFGIFIPDRNIDSFLEDFETYKDAKKYNL